MARHKAAEISDVPFRRDPQYRPISRTSQVSTTHQPDERPSDSKHPQAQGAKNDRENEQDVNTRDASRAPELDVDPVHRICQAHPKSKDTRTKGA